MFLKGLISGHYGVLGFLVPTFAVGSRNFIVLGMRFFFGPRGVRRWFEPLHISNQLVTRVGVCSLFGALR